MKQFICGFACLALAVSGCGEDDPADGDGGTSGTSGTSNQAGESTAGGGEPTGTGGVPVGTGGAPTDMGGAATGGAPSGNVECDPTLEGVCQNATDCPKVQNGEARMAAGACGQGCLGKAESCAVECIVKETDMTSECATCYAGAVACATKNCLSPCIQDPESEACKTCQVEKGCRAEFNTCSGLPE